MSASYKTLVIGLDGATFDLLEPWANAGELPTIRRLMKQGAWGRLHSTIPPMTAPAWTSFATGKNPGKHGLYDWIYRHSDSYAVSPMTAQHIAEPTLWSLLSAAGRRVCVVNVPMTFPPPAVNGLVVAGMPAPSTQVTITYPQPLLGEIEAAVGEYLLYPDPGQAYSDSGVDAFLKRLYATTERRLEVLDYLRGREEFDFFMLVFNGTDTVQHALWKAMSPAHPLHEPAKKEKYGNAIRDYYRSVDRALGKIVDGLDERTVLMVMSDHGFGPFHKFIHVNSWLMQEGFLRIKPDALSRLKAGLFKLGFAPMKVYDLLMRLGLGGLKREVVRGQGQGLLKTLFLSFDDIDWSRTRAYSLGNVGQVNINVRGREPHGVVEPGTEYESLRDEVSARLRELRDSQTGELVVEQIFRREEIYHGARLERAADLLFLPTRLEYFGFGEYEFGSNQVIEPMKRGISGTHRMYGVLMLAGAPIKPGLEITGANLTDLAPTLLHLMGEPVLSDMDGRVLTEALRGELADPASIRTVAPPSAGDDTSRDSGLSTDDQEVIVERLRSLGYVG